MTESLSQRNRKFLLIVQGARRKLLIIWYGGYRFLIAMLTIAAMISSRDYDYEAIDLIRMPGVEITQ